MRAALFLSCLASSLLACQGPSSGASSREVSKLPTKLSSNAPPVDLGGMIFIPAGTFGTGHALGAFYIDRDEVTVADYARFVETYGLNPDPQQPIVLTDGAFLAAPGSADRPISFVSWTDAFMFCAYAGKSLPTEAEWERAAKATTQLATGNVAEWVADWYAPNPKFTPLEDPRGPEDGTLRVVRGGSANDPLAATRTTARSGADPYERFERVGFRCVYRP